MVDEPLRVLLRLAELLGCPVHTTSWGIQIAPPDAHVCSEAGAAWCPVCGDCTCERDDEGAPYADDPACLLHGAGSFHAGEVDDEGDHT